MCGDFNARVTGYECKVSNKGGDLLNSVKIWHRWKLKMIGIFWQERNWNKTGLQKYILDFTIVSDSLEILQHEIILANNVYSHHLNIKVTIKVQKLAI